MEYTVSESARLLGVDPRTLRRWVREARFEQESDTVDQRQRLLSKEQVLLLARRHNCRGIEAKIGTDGYLETLPEMTTMATQIAALDRSMDELKMELRAEVRGLHERMTGLARQAAQIEDAMEGIARRLQLIEERAKIAGVL